MFQQEHIDRLPYPTVPPSSEGTGASQFGDADGHAEDERGRAERRSDLSLDFSRFLIFDL